MCVCECCTQLRIHGKGILVPIQYGHDVCTKDQYMGARCMYNKPDARACRGPIIWDNACTVTHVAQLSLMTVHWACRVAHAR